MLPVFGLGKQIIHDERVAYTHACGNVQPGDSFSSDAIKITCNKCKSVCLCSVPDFRPDRGGYELCNNCGGTRSLVR